MTLEILYQDDYFVAINKPNGLLVHRTKIATDATEFALQKLRNQLDQKVFPCHRLDRKTSGVLLFAKDNNSNSLMQQAFMNNEVKKAYLAILRGHTETNGEIDYPLFNDSGVEQAALTYFKTLAKSEINIPTGKFDTSRYSLVEARPQTGRMHQLRKHFAHIFHPIIGDRPHGCNKQNKLFKERWNMTNMLLHASSISFQHPVSKKEIKIEGKLPLEFERMLNVLELKS